MNLLVTVMNTKLIKFIYSIFFNFNVPSVTEENIATKLVKKVSRLHPLRILYPEILLVVDSTYFK